jgi:hypothetical protein
MAPLLAPAIDEPLSRRVFGGEDARGVLQHRTRSPAAMFLGIVKGLADAKAVRVEGRGGYSCRAEVSTDAAQRKETHIRPAASKHGAEIVVVVGVGGMAGGVDRLAAI